MIKLDPEFVDQYYPVDYAVEDILPSGRYLTNDMHVLIEDPFCREDVTVYDTAGMKQRRETQKHNRWCKVTHLLILDDQINFLAVYADGSKIKRQVGINNAWVVKLATIPEHIKEALMGTNLDKATSVEMPGVMEAPFIEHYEDQTVNPKPSSFPQYVSTYTHRLIGQDKD
jgi:hypothetical protein